MQEQKVTLNKEVWIWATNNLSFHVLWMKIKSTSGETGIDILNGTAFQAAANSKNAYFK